MAEREGFEPPEPCGSRAFQARAFDHSATSPGVPVSSLATSPPSVEGAQRKAPGGAGQPPICPAFSGSLGRRSHRVIRGLLEPPPPDLSTLTFQPRAADAPFAGPVFTGGNAVFTNRKSR